MENSIFLVEDHPLFSLGLVEIINDEEDMVVCGSSQTVSGALKKIPDINPDIVIVDITLKDGSGFEVLQEMKRNASHIPVLILSMHHESLYAESAIMAGAKGYIMKHEAPGFVIQAIRTLLDGKRFVSNTIKDSLLEGMLSPGMPSGTNDSPISRLTVRELEVFELIGMGMTSQQISEQMKLSIKTIGTYRDRIKNKLNVQNINQLIALAAKWKIEHI